MGTGTAFKRLKSNGQRGPRSVEARPPSLVLSELSYFVDGGASAAGPPPSAGGLTEHATLPHLPGGGSPLRMASQFFLMHLKASRHASLPSGLSWHLMHVAKNSAASCM